MCEKFLNVYRIPSARLKSWDYRSNGAYFITICTQNRISYFGKIVHSQFVESEIGVLVRQCWYEIPVHCPEIKLGSFIVMPNHVHGILVIDNDFSLSPIDESRMDQFHSIISPKKGSIATAVRSFKSAVSKYGRELNPEFRWQSRYYDHIIRDYRSYMAICDYIETNPEHWKDDRMSI